MFSIIPDKVWVIASHLTTPDDLDERIVNIGEISREHLDTPAKRSDFICDFFKTASPPLYFLQFVAPPEEDEEDIENMDLHGIVYQGRVKMNHQGSCVLPKGSREAIRLRPYDLVLNEAGTFIYGAENLKTLLDFPDPIQCAQRAAWETDADASALRIKLSQGGRERE